MANPMKLVKVVKKATQSKVSAKAEYRANAKKEATRAKTNAIQKNSVKVKPKTTKPKRNPSDPAKIRYKDNSSYTRAEMRSIYKTGGGA
jgi:hypothetical protein